MRRCAHECSEVLVYTTLVSQLLVLEGLSLVGWGELLDVSCKTLTLSDGLQHTWNYMCARSDITARIHLVHYFRKLLYVEGTPTTPNYVYSVSPVLCSY